MEDSGIDLFWVSVWGSLEWLELLLCWLGAPAGLGDLVGICTCVYACIYACSLGIAVLIGSEGKQEDMRGTQTTKGVGGGHIRLFMFLCTLLLGIRGMGRDVSSEG